MKESNKRLSDGFIYKASCQLAGKLDNTTNENVRHISRKVIQSVIKKRPTNVIVNSSPKVFKKQAGKVPSFQVNLFKSELNSGRNHGQMLNSTLCSSPVASMNIKASPFSRTYRRSRSNIDETQLKAKNISNLKEVNVKQEDLLKYKEF